MSAIVITHADGVALADHPELPNQLHSDEVVIVEDVARIERITHNLVANDGVVATDTASRLWYRSGNLPVSADTPSPCRYEELDTTAWRLNPVLGLPWATVDPGDTLSFTIEDWIKGSTLAAPLVRVRNPKGASTLVEITQFVEDHTAKILETWPMVREVLTPNTGVDFVVPGTLSRNSRVTHRVAMTNNDIVFRTLYVAIYGWSGIPTHMPANEIVR